MKLRCGILAVAMLAPNVMAFTNPSLVPRRHGLGVRPLKMNKIGSLSLQSTNTPTAEPTDSKPAPARLAELKAFYNKNFFTLGMVSLQFLALFWTPSHAVIRLPSQMFSLAT
jgi:hypothetical protein